MSRWVFYHILQFIYNRQLEQALRCYPLISFGWTFKTSCKKCWFLMCYNLMSSDIADVYCSCGMKWSLTFPLKRKQKSKSYIAWVPQVLHTVRPVCLVSVVILSKNKTKNKCERLDLLMGSTLIIYKVSRAFKATFKPETTISAGKYPKSKHL